jgi:ABC-type histidine transport system ATPase subunit
MSWRQAACEKLAGMPNAEMPNAETKNRHDVAHGPPGVAIIAANDVSKRFLSHEVLTRVSLAVRQREVLCVVGPSGSGKTTLLRCLALLEEPSEGHVTMNGVTIAAPRADAVVRRAARAVRPDIGMVFQHFNLWPRMSVLLNIIEAPVHVKAMAKREAVDMAERLLAKVGLADKRDAYPMRLPAVSNSASPSLARSPCRPRSCCSTSRPRRSTPSCAARCWWSCATWRAMA